MDSDRKESEKGPFDWPASVWAALVMVLIFSVAAVQHWSEQSTEQYERQVREAMWTTFNVANPDTVHLGHLHASTEDREVLCGRINYEKTAKAGGGWSGFTNFYQEHGVIYIAPAHGRYEARFRALCQPPIEAEPD